MSFTFPVRSTAGSASTHRRDTQSAGSLPAISEDASSFLEPREAPPVPPRAWNRPLHKDFALGAPPNLSFDGSPPPYTHFESSKDKLQGTNEEKLTKLRRLENNKHIAKRGGWKRLAIIVAIVILCLVGLIVGLVVGLRNRNQGSSSERNFNGNGTRSGGASGTVNRPADSSRNATFPAGSYRFVTYLNTVSTGCTSNPATWRCYPYFTYATSPTQSTASFDWIISHSVGSNYTISSTENYFSIIFNIASLSLMNAGADDEHYFFQTTMDKPTKPVAQLGGQNLASTCYFNSTTLQGYLYTKKPKTFMVNNDSPSMDTNAAFSAWPYAVKVVQIASGRSGSPACLGPSGENLGDFSVADSSQQCNCLYLNTGT